MRKMLVVLIAIQATFVACSMYVSHVKHSSRRTLQYDDFERSYILHVPPDAKGPMPLIVCLHGGGGTGAQMETMSGFSPLADLEGFAVVYPDGINKNWNDGREGNFSNAHKNHRDDAGFIEAVIDAVSLEVPIDPKRIHATGISNGGIMSHYLGGKLSGRFAAIAPVVGGLADPYCNAFKPERPVSVAIFQGTDDPLVPYCGGPITVPVFGMERGKIVDTNEAVRKWIAADGCVAEGVTEAVTDLNPDDGCTVTRTTWSKGTDGAEVVLYRIEGGGHTWPGGTQYLPKALIGNVCRDINATELIWEFFKAHPRRR